MKLAPTAVRYIKLGRNGAYLERCLAEGVIELGYSATPHELAAANDWEAVADRFVEEGRTAGKAKSFTREIREFYTLGDDCLWITFGHGRLWWAFAAPDVVPLNEPDRGARLRRTVGGWSDRTLGGETLAISRISTRLTKVAAYQQTICRVDAEDYLLRRLNDEDEPAVARAREASSGLNTAALELIQALDWADFELLVDLIFAASGWRRISAVGGSSQADSDILLEQVATGERAFVQVKSRADQKVLADYVERFDNDGSFNRMFFACHTPKGIRDIPDRPEIHVWLGERLAQQAVAAGLLTWLIEKVR